MKKLILILNILSILTVSSFATNGGDDCKTIKNKKALRLYDEAIAKLKSNEEEAIQILIEATKVEPEFVDAYFTLGGISFDKLDKIPANINELRKIERTTNKLVEYYGKVIEYCPAFYDYISYYYLGKYYYTNHKNELALTNLKEFVARNNKNSVEIAESKEYIKNIEKYKFLLSHPVPFKPKTLEGVSSGKDEFLPLISPDGEMAFYTRRYLKQDMNSIAACDVDEFSFSKLLSLPGTEITIFDDGMAMPSPFNAGKDQGGVTITIDNKNLYISMCEFTRVGGQPYKNCDLYSSNYEDGKWTVPINMGTNINGTSTWEGQPSISPDGKVLYFASAREGGLGGIDIYRTLKDNLGNWAKAENLGNVINSAGNDKSPYIHTDSQTLYFSSDGLFGLGGYDIYFSKMDDFGKWSEPENIGFPINTEDDDLGFVVSTDGHEAYFSSNKLSGKGGWDIYSFDLYEKARPENVVFLKGQLVNDKGDALTDAKIVVKNIKTAKVTEGIVDKNTGEYALAVAVKKDEDVVVTVKKDGYAFASQYIKPIVSKTQTHLDVVADIKPMEVRIDIPAKLNFEVKKIEVGTTIKLNNIYFETNSANLKPESIVVLDNFIEFLEENQTIKFIIQGHTDDVGDDAQNMILSTERAKSVYNYLVLMDIDPSRISYKGLGETKPVAKNDSDAHRALNRRTEFVITSK
ncbi:MAG: hypothetical protein A2033_17750 [Bacteroidetes bacterium GWA2_31_9]|nr:MAG: hypothetical protein A2033_17750 [Bacteroidetes bacterium GWA2_31_9]